MRRIVFVGCGGSGNAVIGYLMDRLQATLSSHGFDRLPETWQFVVVDARQQPEEADRGLGTVRDMGGTYIPVSPPVGSYSVVDASMTHALDHMATWSPRDPSAVRVPVQDGAGQMRSIGRVLLVSQASEVQEALDSAAKRTKEVAAARDATQLRELCGDFPEEGSTQPMAIVITSMAGGSGASMALDVCRLLGTAYNLQQSALFTFTPDIFDSLAEHQRSGVRPNSLAMLGEIVAMQMGQGQKADEEFLRAVGIPVSGGRGLPVRRVIPVGRFAADGTPFGDGTMSSVYRALGSALASLVVSEKALEGYVKEVIENSTPTPPNNKSLFGWGSDHEALQWGSFGYASLSMGRDRYAEYASQRLARSAADHLLRGHLLDDDDVSGDVQVRRIVAVQIPQVRERTGLPPRVDTATNQEVTSGLFRWMQTPASGLPAVSGRISQLVRSLIVDLLPQGSGSADSIARQARARIREQESLLTRDLESLATETAYEWHGRVVEGIEREVSVALGQYGAVYARELLQEIHTQLLGPWGAKGFRDVAAGLDGRVPQVAKPDNVLGRLTGTVNDIRAALLDPIDKMFKQVGNTIAYAEFARRAADACEDIARGVVLPLSKAVGSLVKTWEDETKPNREVLPSGLSQTATETYAQWPAERDHSVAERWFTAHNEVLLTDPSIFADRYRTDLSRSMSEGDSAMPYADAVKTAVRGVITGLWQTTAGDSAPGSAVKAERFFVANTFKVRPDKPEETLTPVAGKYRIDLGAVDLLRRSRMLVARPDHSFSTFVRTSIQEYADGSEGAEAIARGFTDLLSMAQPLAQVANHTYTRLHGTQIAPRVNYTFSEIPLRGTLLEESLRRSAQVKGAVTVHNLDRSLVTKDVGATEINAFGYFPSVLPPVFDNILGPVRKQWAQAQISPGVRQEFWQYRRARPLTGSLAMSEAERRALVGGWLVGQLVGRLDVPGDPYDTPVKVWDGQHSEWVDFPWPLLHAPSSFVRSYDWLPAILESHLLAVADFNAEEVPGRSMRPYQVLRGLWDAREDGPTDPGAGMLHLNAKVLVHEWLHSGEIPRGAVSRGEAPTLKERQAKALDYLRRFKDLAERESAPLPSPRDRERAALLRDLTGDVKVIVDELVAILEAPSRGAVPSDERIY